VTWLERVLVEQEVVLANQKMRLKVSLATRNLWQQQECLVSTDWISYNYLKAQHLIADLLPKGYLAGSMIFS
jgi:hypothetical protein